jgi:hypothetical protein
MNVRKCLKISLRLSNDVVFYSMTTRGVRIFLAVVLGVILMLVGFFILLLYIVPELRVGGVTAVFERSKYTTYFGDGIDAAFSERNMIIESHNTEIVIRIRKIGFEDEARIQVFEDANGIAFNSMKRTQVDLLHYLDEDGVPYTKLILREPEGAVLRTAKVYINLKRDPNIPDGQQPAYNFILNTELSKVSFEYDPEAEFMQIDKLVMNGTGFLTLPEPLKATTQNPKPFELNIGEFEVNAPIASVTCKSKITRTFTVNGNSTKIILGEVGDVAVNGTTNNIYVDKVGRDLSFNSKYGILQIYEQCAGRVLVRSQTVKVNIRKTNDLDVETYNGSVSVNGVSGFSSIKMEDGVLALGVRAYANAASNDLGVYGNVFIEKKYGGASVIYANYASANGSCTVRRAYDGNFNIHGVRGVVDIEVAAMGNANISVGFSAIAPGCVINVLGSREPLKFGEIAVVLLDENLGITLRVENTYTATDFIPLSKGGGGGVTDNIKNYNIYHEHYTIRAGSHTVIARTQSKFSLQQGTY